MGQVFVSKRCIIIHLDDTRWIKLRHILITFTWLIVLHFFICGYVDVDWFDFHAIAKIQYSNPDQFR